MLTTETLRASLQVLRKLSTTKLRPALETFCEQIADQFDDQQKAIVQLATENRRLVERIQVIEKAINDTAHKADARHERHEKLLGMHQGCLETLNAERILLDTTAPGEAG